MGKKYTRAEMNAKIEKAVENMSVFYRAACVNHTGTTYKADGNEYYTEIVSDYLLNYFDLFNQIKKIKRANYKVDTHNGTTPRPTSNRLEERIALSLHQKYLRPIGKIIDYQIPLKSIQKDDAGKIDLMAFDEATGILRLIELKAPKSTETLLRCVLEIYTYYKTVDTDTLIDNYGLAGKCKEIRICPLFFKDSTQNKEYDSLIEHRNLISLMNKISNDEVKVELLRFPFEDNGLIVSALKAINMHPSGDCKSSSSKIADQTKNRGRDKPVIFPVSEQPNGFPFKHREVAENRTQLSELMEIEILSY